MEDLDCPTVISFPHRTDFHVEMARALATGHQLRKVSLLVDKSDKETLLGNSAPSLCQASKTGLPCTANHSCCPSSGHLSSPELGAVGHLGLHSAGAFVICWTPGQVVLLLDGLDCKSCNVLAVEKYFLLLAEANSLVNAVVYSCRDAEMRRTFRRLLCCLCLRRSTHESAHYTSSTRTGASTRIMLPENGHPLMDSTL